MKNKVEKKRQKKSRKKSSFVMVNSDLFTQDYNKAIT